MRSSLVAWLAGRCPRGTAPPGPTAPSLAHAARFCSKCVTRFSRATEKGVAAARALRAGCMWRASCLSKC